jgi:hypothetical protein
MCNHVSCFVSTCDCQCILNQRGVLRQSPVAFAQPIGNRGLMLCTVWLVQTLITQAITGAMSKR